MLKNKTFAKKTKRGNVINIVREHYLRDDIGTGVGTVLEANAACYVIPDTNVILHQIQVLESPTISNVIILQTVLDEVKNQNMSIYNRLKNMISLPDKHFYLFSNEHHRDTYIERNKDETMNDRNDRAIRVAALWYQRTLSEGKPIFLLTNDAENLRKAKEMDIAAKTVHDHVNEMTTHPELVDLLSYLDASENADHNSATPGKMAARELVYAEHLPLSEITKGIQTKKYYQGILFTNRNNPNEATIEVETLKESPVILIKGFKDINRAVNGDLVAVQLLPKENWTKPSNIVVKRDDIGTASETVEEEFSANSLVPVTGSSSSNGKASNNNNSSRPTGKVVGIIKRNWKAYCGSLDEDTDVKPGMQQAVFFVPVDKRIPRIRIRTRQAAELMTKRITAIIESWPPTSRWPEGRYVSTLGDIGDRNVEAEVILLEHDIPHYAFPDNVMKCLPPDDWCITEDEVKKRRDLRDINICSIDPPGCKDIDDALHARELANGNYEIGVHIADVTHFVKEGTALDDEASKRSTSVYLVDRRIDMLPKLLTEQLCSIVANADRLAFSVIWELTKDAKIVKTEFCKTVIRSRAAMSYEQAQTILDDSARNDQTAKELRILLNISRILKQRRVEAGSLTLASPQVKFDLDSESMTPMDVEMYQMRETNSLVEEFMLFANISVAEKIYDSFPAFACLRRHPSPVPWKLDALNKSLATIGHKLESDSSKVLAESLDKCKVKNDPLLNTLIRILTTRCMEQAVYFSSSQVPREQFHHYGLAVPIYTHFTSPIRRYADDLVHRLLAAALDLEPLAPKVTDKNGMTAVASNMNQRHRSAQYASRASVELYTLTYFKEKTVVETAYVSKVKQNAVIVYVPRYGIESIIYVCDIDEDANQANNALWEYDAEMECLKHKQNKQLQLKVFDKVKIQIYVKTSKNYRSKLIMELVDPPLTQQLAAAKADPPKDANNDKKRKREANASSAATSTSEPAKKGAESTPAAAAELKGPNAKKAKKAASTPNSKK